MILDIIKIGDERLKLRSKDIEFVDSNLKKFIKNMEDTLKKSKGVGLAAPQVGINKKIILVKPQKEIFVFINPKIIYKSIEMISDDEGCLSVPGEFINIKRHKEIEMEFLALDNKLYKIKVKDFFARIIQHENDHLEGVLIVDKK